MAEVAEGQDAVASHLQGGIVVNIRETRTARLNNIHDRIMSRQGFYPWQGSQPCSCYQSPCGYRAYPGVTRIKDLQTSDFLKLLRRAGWKTTDIDAFAKFTEDMRTMNERLRREGQLRKVDMMFLGRVPGPLVRGLSHDFPADFATSDGVSVDAQHKHLEKLLTDFFVNKCYRAAGATA